MGISTHILSIFVDDFLFTRSRLRLIIEDVKGELKTAAPAMVGLPSSYLYSAITIHIRNSIQNPFTTKKRPETAREICGGLPDPIGRFTGVDGGLDQPGEPVVWDGRLIVSCFDLVTGPGKVNKKHEMPATLVSLRL